jgi:hypothetical protein
MIFIVLLALTRRFDHFGEVDEMIFILLIHAGLFVA